MEWQRCEPPFKPDSLHLWGLFGIAAFAAARFVPFDRLNISLCAFHQLTGWPCPSCGMTTCFVHLAHGEILAGLVVSPLGTLVFAGTAGAIFYVVWTWLLRRPVYKFRLTGREIRWMLWGGGVMLLANWGWSFYRLAAG